MTFGRQFAGEGKRRQASVVAELRCGATVVAASIASSPPELAGAMPGAGTVVSQMQYMSQLSAVPVYTRRVRQANPWQKRTMGSL
jgi:hypothetical protein